MAGAGLPLPVLQNCARLPKQIEPLSMRGRQWKLSATEPAGDAKDARLAL